MFNQTTTASEARRRFFKWPSWRRAIGIIAFCLAAAAQGQTNDLLLDLLVKKGIVTPQEADELKKEADSLKTNNTSLSFSKWKIGDGIRSVELFGDIRLRYESRSVRTPEDGLLELDRFRYALRLGLRGDLASDFYYGLRLETAANPRSPWVTFGSSTSGTPFYGPFGKSTAGIDVGQIYLGWRPISAIDITVGKMPNPLMTTPMLWDTDINPEGAAERFKYNIGPAEFFATFSQFLYLDDNPNISAFGLYSANGTNKANLPFLLAWQGGVKYQLAKNISFKGAGTLYNYLGHGTNTVSNGTFAGSPGFSDIYVGEGAGVPVVGASGYPSGSADGFAYNQTGINNLLVLDFPVEVNFKVLKHQGKVFGDFAENLDGADRARAAVAAADNPLIYATPLHIPLQKNQNKAYQAGVAVGNDDDLGLVYGTALKKRTWETRVYWQHVEQYALDPNLLDSDFFEGRGNLQGLYTAFAYGFTDALIGTVRYGFASRIDKKLGTGGSNLDIPQVNPVNHYSVVQLDLTLKF
jgi:hypothetical protein